MRVLNRAKLCQSLQQEIQKWDCDALLAELENNSVPVGEIKTLEKVFTGQADKNLILEEEKDGESTKRVRTSVYTISSMFKFFVCI